MQNRSIERIESVPLPLFLSLSSISLRFNNLGERGVLKMAEALMINTSVREIMSSMSTLLFLLNVS
jgi:hypothetical protein